MNDAQLLALLEAIARRELGVQSLRPNGRDRDDFVEVHVEALACAMLAAYRAGRESR
jgi:hypothetical protein